MSGKKDSLGDRMKGYEGITRSYLTRRIPAIIRIDGRAFHTFTRGMRKPFDRIFMSTMQDTMKFLCENVEGCVFGYTQSDEITLVLRDYATINTEAWFGYNVQKICSVSASMATLAFSNAYSARLAEAMRKSGGTNEYITALASKTGKAMFDARVFSIPREEVCNCLIWRQQDAIRNSVEAVGQAHFSPRELHGKNCGAVLDMLREERGVNWDDFPTDCRRGSACYKEKVFECATVPDKTSPDGEKTVEFLRNRWLVDREPPVFSEEREYIERWI